MPASVDPVDEDDVVVDDDAGERDHAERREDAEVVAGQDVAQHGADRAERDRGDDQRWLQERVQRDRHQRIHDEQGDEEATGQAHQDIHLLLLVALEAPAQSRVAPHQLRHHVTLKARVDRVGAGVRVALVDVAADPQGPLLVDAGDRR